MTTSAKNPALHLFKMFFSGGEEVDTVQQKISDLLPFIVYIYDANTKKLSYVNKKITEFLGYDVEELGNLDDHLGTLVHKDDAEIVARELEKFAALKDEEAHSYNSRLNHKQGTWKYFRTTGSILKRNDEGHAESFLFIAEDITHTVETEEEMRVKKDLIAETEGLLQFGTWNWDAVTGKITLSDGMFTLLGCQREDAEISPAFYESFMSQEDIDILMQKTAKAVENKEGFEHIYNLTTKSGEQKIVSTNGKVVLSADGTLTKIMGTSRDVTEQVSAYRELFNYKQMTLEKEQFLESGSWEVDLTTGKITWSDGMYRLFGYDPAIHSPLPEVTGEFYFSHFSPEEMERTKQDWDEFLKNGDNYVREETITAKNGTRKRLETYGKVVRQPTGIAVKAMGATKDISRLKEYERQLEKKLRELERSNKDLEEFAYVASHDLQEPLRKISTFSERLKMKFDNELGDEGRGYITRMLSATANMRMLIENLLNFSRLTSTGVAYETADTGTLLDEVLTEIELQIDDSHTTIIKENMPVLPVISSQVKQLLGNIILNAIKFRKPNEPPVIKITGTQVSNQDLEKYELPKDITYYAISISDNGIGFEQEYAGKIFQIFQRLHGKSEYPGAGIGLAICKKIAENHHGKLFASGIPGEGAVFTVILPVTNN